MKFIEYTQSDFDKQCRLMAEKSSLFDPDIEKSVKTIVDDVKNRGDSALIDLTEKFDGVKLDRTQLSVTTAELMEASLRADESLRKALECADKNVAAYAKRSLRKNWEMENNQGGIVGEKYDPIQRVGVYIPGGSAPLVSTAIMTVSLARVAGCKEIVVCTPCGKDGMINPALLFAARFAGATEIYKVGGAQAVAAMAIGTETIKPVNKIFGPGNAYVVTAKRLLFGYAAIDLLPGPSELLVIADDSAVPKFVAIDLLAQAEHGSGYERVWLISPSSKLIKAVQREVEKLVKTLSRGEKIGKVLNNNCWFVRVKSIEEAAEIANQLAPEHCEIITKNPEKLVSSILTAGAIFIGNYTPTVLGDYVAGPSHTLPTGGAGKSFSGLSVDQFLRRTSIVKYNKGSLKKSLTALRTIAGVEGLEAHLRSAEIRFE
ncbi:MAG: histidinol dehydrogenase [Verrucomicrobiia bacterium]